jgi:8-oxo-(d)GTP phosphatase
VIPAAGAVPWRIRNGDPEVLLVHRPAYDDWAWAKGKLDPGEEWPVAAVREVEEETGFRVRLGRPLPGSEYTMLDRRTGEMATKEVRYWAAEVTGGDGILRNEIDQVVWLEARTAWDRLSYARDRDQLRALVRAAQAGTLRTWPLALIRHAKAFPRGTWTHEDHLRPLDMRGVERAAELVPLLSAYQFKRLVSSPSVRCTETLSPYAGAIGKGLRLKPGLSEEGFAADPDLAVKHLARILDRGKAAAVCSHGPVLPSLLEHLAARVHPTEDPDQKVALALSEAADLGMAKGETLVAHLVGAGDQAWVVDVERYLP